MSEMIERVARNIARARHHSCCETRPLSDFPISANEMREARAAIEAMREPTEAMLDAFHDGLHSCQDDRFSECATAGYRAMITAALPRAGDE